jgi:cell division transport system permease protein
MKITNLKRVLVFALQDFKRNMGITLATVFVLLVAMALVSGIFFFQGMMSYLVSQIQDKIDIAAYFNSDASEEDILAVKEAILASSPDIKAVEYVSSSQALAEFNEKHSDNPTLARALEQVGGNPFLPSLNIITNGESSQYEEVYNTLETADYAKLIYKVDYSEKKDTIEKVNSIISNVNKVGIIVAIILIVVAILVVFNTIKLAVENSKAEINTMKIVGAGNWFVQGPFVIQGVIYGVVAFVICTLLMGVASYMMQARVAVILPGFNTLSYFFNNLWFFSFIQLGFGVGVGVISGLIIIKKHLKK